MPACVTSRAVSCVAASLLPPSTYALRDTGKATKRRSIACPWATSDTALRW